MMATQHNRRFAVTQRREKVTELYVKSWSQASIAGELNVSQSTVSEDVQYVRRKWEQSAIRNFDELRTRELHKLDFIEREAWDAWERSKKPAQSATVTGEGNGQQTRKSMKNQTGDPRFLDQVSKCISHRRAITGLDAPLQVADVTPPPPEETAEQRKARVDEIFRAAGVAIEKGEPRRRRLISPDSDSQP
jgi:predicted transcriptional regulator